MVSGKISLGNGQNLPEHAPACRMGDKDFFGPGFGGGVRAFTPESRGAETFLPAMGFGQSKMGGRHFLGSNLG